MIRLRPINPATVAGFVFGLIGDDPDLPDGMTPDAWKKSFVARFRCLGVYADAQLVGVVGYTADQVHLAVLPEWRGRWFSDRIGRAIIAYGLERSPQLVAVIRVDDWTTQRLASAYGFRLEGSEGKWTRWRLKPAAPSQARRSAA